MLGSVTVPVSGDSMLPTLRPGERVALHAVEPDAIRPRDVVAFRNADGHLVLHRVHAVQADRLVTAGDRQPLIDPPVPLAAVVGLARGVAPRPQPRPWPPRPGPADVDVWLVGGDEPVPDLPAGWRLHRRPAVGVGVGDDVLEELRAAVRDRPCVGLTGHAVHAAADVLSGGLEPGTQVLVGCSFGRPATPVRGNPVRGNPVPTSFVDLFVRLGPPAAALDRAETLYRFAALVGGGSLIGGTA